MLNISSADVNFIIRSLAELSADKFCRVAGNPEVMLEVNKLDSMITFLETKLPRLHPSASPVKMVSAMTLKPTPMCWQGRATERMKIMVIMKTTDSPMIDTDLQKLSYYNRLLWFMEQVNCVFEMQWFKLYSYKSTPPKLILESEETITDNVPRDFLRLSIYEYDFETNEKTRKKTYCFLEILTGNLFAIKEIHLPDKNKLIGNVCDKDILFKFGTHGVLETFGKKPFPSISKLLA